MAEREVSRREARRKKIRALLQLEDHSLKYSRRKYDNLTARKTAKRLEEYEKLLTTQGSGIDPQKWADVRIASVRCVTAQPTARRCMEGQLIRHWPLSSNQKLTLGTNEGVHCTAMRGTMESTADCLSGKRQFVLRWFVLMQFRSVVFSLQESEIRELRAQARGIVAKQREAESGVVRSCSITLHHGMHSCRAGVGQLFALGGSYRR